MNYPTMPAIPPTPPEQPQPSRNNKVVAAVGMSVVIALGVGIFAGTWIDSDATDATDAKPSASASPTRVDPVERPDFVPEPETSYVTPEAEDFTIELTTKSKQCFGSAGCILKVEPDLTYNGYLSELDPEVSYDVIYEITGDESGMIVETLTLSDQDDVSFSQTMVSTSSSAVVPKAKVVGVEGY